MKTPTFDKGQRREAPPLQGRGLGWGLSVEQLAELHRRAAEMRRNPTEPEKRLWRHLSNGQLESHKFRRQSVIGHFIADFLCPQKALIVEVDGDTHDEAKDRLRDDILAERGFRVARVTNDDVMTNMDGVLTMIAGVLQTTPDRWNNPHPNPSPEGEGLFVRGDPGGLGDYLSSPMAPAAIVPLRNRLEINGAPVTEQSHEFVIKKPEQHAQN